MSMVKKKNLHSLSPNSEKKSRIIADVEIKSIANLIFEKLQEDGCQTKDIINVSSQLLELVSNEITYGKRNSSDRSSATLFNSSAK